MVMTTGDMTSDIPGYLSIIVMMMSVMTSDILLNHGHDDESYDE